MVSIEIGRYKIGMYERCRIRDRIINKREECWWSINKGESREGIRREMEGDNKGKRREMENRDRRDGEGMGR